MTEYFITVNIPIETSGKLDYNEESEFRDMIIKALNECGFSTVDVNIEQGDLEN